MKTTTAMTTASLLLASALTTTTAFLARPTTTFTTTTKGVSRRGVPLKMAFEAEAGVTAPLGYWDPLGFSSDGDVEKFNRYRAHQRPCPEVLPSPVYAAAVSSPSSLPSSSPPAVEIKHGRIAQLAVLHYIVTYFVRLPGSLGDTPIADIPSGLAAIQAVPAAGWAQVLLFTSALEILAPQSPDKIPGDVQPDTPLFAKLEGKSTAEATEYQNKEINNGRLAQVAILGIWIGELVSGGQHPIDTLLSKISG